MGLSPGYTIEVWDDVWAATSRVFNRNNYSVELLCWTTWVFAAIELQWKLECVELHTCLGGNAFMSFMQTVVCVIF